MNKQINRPVITIDRWTRIVCVRINSRLVAEFHIPFHDNPEQEKKNGDNAVRMAELFVSALKSSKDFQWL